MHFLKLLTIVMSSSYIYNLILKILLILLLKGMKNGWPIISTLVLSSQYIRGPIITTISLSEKEHEIQQLFQNNNIIPLDNLQSSVTSMKWIKVNSLKYST